MKDFGEDSSDEDKGDKSPKSRPGGAPPGKPKGAPPPIAAPKPATKFKSE